MVTPPSASDLIALQQQGVSPKVIKAMQEMAPAPRTATTALVSEPTPPVVIGGYYYGYPYRWGAHYHYGSCW